MDHPDREAEPYFSQPVRQIVLMLFSLALVAAGAYLAYPRVAPVFLANPYLNGVIMLVFVFGVFACFWQVLQLVSSVNWIEGFAVQRPGHQIVAAPRLLAPLAALLRSRGKRMQLSASSAGSILDSVATRIDEARDITRYLVNLLIFLGLLGTFYGLATTVPAVVETIRSLAPSENDSGIDVFSRLMNGLESQLGGMGVAFSSSLLGLAGSLVVGLLELFASHGQNRFYRELEEWLSTITRLSFSGSDGDSGEQSAAVAALDHMAEQMSKLEALFFKADESRELTHQRLGEVTRSIERLTTRLEGEPSVTDAVDRIVKGQERLIATLEMRGPAAEGQMDAESRMRLRSIDVQLLRLLEEMSAGRQESVSELRTDLAALTRVIRNLAGEAAQAPGSRRE